MNNYIKQFEEKKQVSSTGARALVLLIALAEEPKAFDELREFVKDCGITEKSYSDDTVRNDLCTLKELGCTITKVHKNGQYCYKLEKHPFMLNMTSEEVKALRLVYKKLCNEVSPSRLLDYHNLFTRLADMVYDESIKEEILGISLLKNSNLKIIEELVKDENKYNKIRILYQTTRTQDKLIDITLIRLGLRNGKLYAFCYNHERQERSFLKVSKITQIVCRMFDKDSPVGLDTCVTFKLKNYKLFDLEETETIITTDNDDAIIQGRYFNDFIATQRMLNLSSNCVVVEPQRIKDTVITKLKEMRALYDGKKR